MLTNCIRAGQENCASAVFMDADGAIMSGIFGARSGGTLNDAKMVTLSRRQKSVYEVMGIRLTGAAAAGGCGVDLGGTDGDGDDGAFAGPAVSVGEELEDGAEEEEDEGAGDAPNILANLASLYTQIDMLTVVVVRNLPNPGVTVAKD